MPDAADAPKKRRAKRRDTKIETAPDTTPEEERNDASEAGEESPSKTEQVIELDNVKAQLAEIKDHQLRLQADFDNFRKRAARERRDSEENGRARLMEKILPVIDNLDRALGVSPNSDDSGLIQGVEMVRSQLITVLEDSGLVMMEVVGVAFDPTKHEAMCTMPSTDVPEGHIVDQAERGYMLGDRVLRPAKVVVASAPD